MPSGGDDSAPVTSSTTVTSPGFDPAIQEFILGDLLPAIEGLFASPTVLNAGEVAPLNETQLGAFDTLGNAGSFIQTGLVDPLSAFINDTLTNVFTDPLAVPGVGESVDALTSGLNLNFENVTLPTIASNSIATGSLGGTEPIQTAVQQAGLLEQAQAEGTASILNTLLPAFLGEATDLVPTVADLSLIPGTLESLIGDTLQVQSQAESDAATLQSNLDALAPIDALNTAIAQILGIGGTTVEGTAVGEAPQGTDFGDALGAGLSGAAAIGAIPGVGTAGIVAGGVVGLLSGLL